MEESTGKELFQLVEDLKKDIKKREVITGENIPLDREIKRSVNYYLVRHYPNLKAYKPFHGACLQCKSQVNLGIGRCVGCKFMGVDHELPDLSMY